MNTKRKKTYIAKHSQTTAIRTTTKSHKQNSKGNVHTGRQQTSEANSKLDITIKTSANQQNKPDQDITVNHITIQIKHDTQTRHRRDMHEARQNKYYNRINSSIQTSHA